MKQLARLEAARRVIVSSWMRTSSSLQRKSESPVWDAQMLWRTWAGFPIWCLHIRAEDVCGRTHWAVVSIAKRSGRIETIRTRGREPHQRQGPQFTESVIREMTRQAIHHNAINLARDFRISRARGTQARRAAGIAADINQYAITWGAEATYAKRIAAQDRPVGKD